MLPQIFETNHRAILYGTQQQPVDPVVNRSHVNMEHEDHPQKKLLSYPMFRLNAVRLLFPIV